VTDRWRPAWADVDLDAVRHNASVLVRLSHPAALCAVVKADGYGHGAVPVARAALEGGADWLAVALVEEGVALREAGIEAPSPRWRRWPRWWPAVWSRPSTPTAPSGT
jgi:alanine racemase